MRIDLNCPLNIRVEDTATIKKTVNRSVLLNMRIELLTPIDTDEE